MSADKAWLLGFLAGDGNIQVESDGGAKVSANCGQDEHLARHVVDLIRQIYGVPCKVRLQQRDPYPNRRHEEHNQSVEHKVHVCHRTDLERYAQLVGFRCERKSKTLAGLCLLCRTRQATHSVPRVIRGRQPCLDQLEKKAPTT